MTGIDSAHEPIAQAEAARDAARAAELRAKRGLVELQQTRSQAEWADAKAAEQAIADGKAPAKTLANVIAHDMKIETAAHEHRVSQLTTQRAEKALQAAWKEHGDEYRAEVKQATAAAESAFRAALRGLSMDFNRFSSTVALGRQLGLDHLGVGSVVLDLRKECEATTGGKVELPTGAVATVRIHVADLLAKFAQLGTPDQEFVPTPTGMPAEVAAAAREWRHNPLSVDQEIAKRQAAERAHSGRAREDKPAEHGVEDYARMSRVMATGEVESDEEISFEPAVAKAGRR
jgi:hypothetical protein